MNLAVVSITGNTYPGLLFLLYLQCVSLFHKVLSPAGNSTQTKDKLLQVIVTGGDKVPEINDKADSFSSTLPLKD